MVEMAADCAGALQNIGASVQLQVKSQGPAQMDAQHRHVVIICRS